MNITEIMFNTLNYLTIIFIILSIITFFIYTHKLSASLGVVTVLKGEVNKGFIDINNEVYVKEQSKIKNFQERINASIFLATISLVINLILHFLK